MDKRVTIVGCGWLGMALAYRLQALGYEIVGTVASHSSLELLQDNRIPGVQLNLDQDDLLDRNIVDGAGVVIAVPYKRRLPDPSTYYLWVKKVVDSAERFGAQWMMMMSSTSVYPQQDGIWTEFRKFEPDSERSEVLSRTEEMVISSRIPSTVLRLAGLIGPGRNPAKRVAEKSQIRFPNQPLNWVHRDDCVGVVEALIKAGERDEIYNVVCTKHPTRIEVVRPMIEALKLETPSFGAETGPSRIISNEKLCRGLGYRFIYPSPLDMPEVKHPTIQ